VATRWPRWARLAMQTRDDKGHDASALTRKRKKRMKTRTRTYRFLAHILRSDVVLCIRRSVGRRWVGGQSAARRQYFGSARWRRASTAATTSTTRATTGVWRARRIRGFTSARLRGAYARLRRSVSHASATNGSASTRSRGGWPRRRRWREWRRRWPRARDVAVEKRTTRTLGRDASGT